MEQVQFTAGCDPEFFLYDEEFERYVSAIPFIKGTKEKPEPLNAGGYIMRDNVAVEFGMIPANNLDEWLENINLTIRDVERYIPEWLTLTPVASANFPKQQLEHPEAVEIGCEPDFNAWTRQQNIPPVDFANNSFRSCGGHIHVGYIGGTDNEHLIGPDGKVLTIRAMDCIHGLWSVVLDDSPESIARRRIYGKAGCYRPTEYGAEYRTLSNFWTTTDRLKELMYRFTADALELVASGSLDNAIETLGGPDNIQRIINEGDVEWVKANYDMLNSFVSKDTQLTITEVIHAART